ncbi:MAG: pirin family protein [Porticoccaceae bacterium]
MKGLNTNGWPRGIQIKPANLGVATPHPHAVGKSMSNSDANPSGSSPRDFPHCPGHPVLETIPARVTELGEGLLIRRALPTRQRRMVGAWCFLDHAGPLDYGPGAGMRVGPHPHIGLQTFTWMIEGEILHRDSLGYEQLIRPGQVNLMTAGRGIVHAEDSVNGEAGRLHAAQLWIALPEAERHRAPAFEHHPRLPVIERDGLAITLLAGTALGETSPARIYSPLVGMDLHAHGSAATGIPLDPAFEYAALSLRGEATVAGTLLAPGTLLYLGSGRNSLAFAAAAEAQVLLLGGEPFAEEILMWWNFVARTPAEIEAATREWNSGRGFGEVKGSPSPRMPAPDMAGLRARTVKRD